MKRHELIFWIIKLPFELLIVYLSFFVARSIRQVTDLIPWVQIPYRYISDDNLVFFAILGALFFVWVFFYLWLYNFEIRKSRARQLYMLFNAWIVWFFLYIWFLYLSLGFLYKDELPRLILFFALIISVFFIFFERLIIDFIHKKLLEAWKIPKTKLAIIANSSHNELIKEISDSSVYEFIWYFNNKQIEDISLKYLWNEKDYNKLSKKWEIEELLYVSSWFSHDLEGVIFEYSRIYWIPYKYVANSYDFTKNNTEISFINKIPVVEIKSIWLNPWWRVLKRIVDILWSFFGLLFLSPLLIAVGILIKKEDPDGPIIFKNKRVWKNQEEFDLFKFRYMKWEYCVKDAYWVKPEDDEALRFEKELIKEKSERTWPLYKILDDPRKTKIWTFIEKYSIDELPQLFNVLIWDMSLIWPRPHQPREVELYKEYQKRVLTLKPWITWMAQTHGRHKNSFEDEVRLDIFYIENWSLLLDFKIILKTINVVLKRWSKWDKSI